VSGISGKVCSTRFNLAVGMVNHTLNRQSLKRRRLSKSQGRKPLDGLSLKFSAGSDATASYPPCTWPGKIASTLSVNHQCIFGKPWFTIPQEQVILYVWCVRGCLTFVLVRELLPELIHQIIFLISSSELEQQEVCIDWDLSTSCCNLSTDCWPHNR